MKTIAEYVELIDDELDGAKDYSERYLYNKSLDSYPDADYYKKMSQDELTHAHYLHEIAIKEIQRMESKFEPTQAMRDAWDRSHIRYVEKTAWIKKMLEM